MNLPDFWLSLEGKVADYSKPLTCHNCHKRLRKRETVCFTLFISPKEHGGYEVGIPGGGITPIAVYCKKCKRSA